MGLSSGQVIAENVPYEEYLSGAYGEHAEWVDGVVIAMPQPTLQELELRWFLRMVFDIYLELSGGGRTLSDPFTMKTGAQLPARQPDAIIILPERLSMLKEMELAGPANLVVEIVSPDSVDRDRGEKFREYEQGGVQEYWILDQDRREALFHVRGEDGLFHSRLPVDGVYTSSVLPTLKLPVSLFWREQYPTVREAVRMVEAMLSET